MGVYISEFACPSDSTGPGIFQHNRTFSSASANTRMTNYVAMGLTKFVSLNNASSRTSQAEEGAIAIDTF